MKIVPTIAGLLLAGTFAVSAEAGPSKGEVLTSCKSEINESFDDVSRVRTAKYKYKSTGTFVTFKVSTDGEIQRVTCTYKDGMASLTDADGELIASKTEAEAAVES